jgi:hypothetical protein
MPVLREPKRYGNFRETKDTPSADGCDGVYGEAKCECGSVGFQADEAAQPESTWSGDLDIVIPALPTLFFDPVESELEGFPFFNAARRQVHDVNAKQAVVCVALS